MGTTAGDHALTAVRESDGAAYPVPREEVERTVRAVGREGIHLEPASALAPAAVETAVADGLVAESDTVVCVATGAGVAWPERTAAAVGDVPTVEPTLAAVEAVIDGSLD